MILGRADPQGIAGCCSVAIAQCAMTDPVDGHEGWQHS
jgi:hypothetical protein